jgi:undecaprenyl diphosphate synthase
MRLLRRSLVISRSGASRTASTLSSAVATGSSSSFKRLRAEAITAHGRNLHLRVAIDYSARESIVQAAALRANP